MSRNWKHITAIWRRFRREPARCDDGYPVTINWINKKNLIPMRPGSPFFNGFEGSSLELYGKEYLRKPTQTDVEKRYAFHEGKHAFPGSTDTKRIRYKQSHKATSKEVERALNVLKKKWAIRETLVRSQSRQTIAKLMYDLTEFMKIVQGVVLQFLWIGYLLLQNETLVCDYNSITLFDDIKAIVTTYNFKPRRKATDQDMGNDGSSNHRARRLIKI
nr:hypothetical protein [Tanacetum cinerariifolium]